MDGGRTGVGSLSLGLRYNKSKAGREYQGLLRIGLLSRCPGHRQGCLNRKAPDQKSNPEPILAAPTLRSGFSHGQESALKDGLP